MLGLVSGSGNNSIEALPLADLIPPPRASSELEQSDYSSNSLGFGASTLAAPEPLPYFGLAIESHKVAGSERVLGNCEVETSRFKLSDGSRYNVNVYTPERPRFEEPVTFATPWCTDLEGFNDDHLGQELAARGFYVIGVSPEQSKLVRALGKVVKAASGDQSELAHDAEAHHLMLDSLQQVGRIASEQVYGVGYSRGAMVGFGLQAYARRHGREFIYSVYTDPCLEHGIDLKKVRYNELPDYALKELGAFGLALAGEHDLHLMHLLKTIRLAPSFWVSQAATGFALFRGEAGTFVDHLSADSNTHVTLYHGSIFNHAEAWQQRLAPFPNITIKNEDGYHASGAKRRVAAASIARLVAHAETQV